MHSQREPAAVPVAATDDRRAIHARQLRALLQMQLNPTTYVQRVIEELSFLPSGGQHWQRDVQLRLPGDPAIEAAEHIHPPRSQPTLQPENRELFIVSLGMFKRRRFADFRVQDAAGNRLALLTRFQHGYCLAMAFILKFLTPSQIGALSKHQNLFDDLYNSLFDFLTSVEMSVQSDAMARAFTALLVALEAPQEVIDEKRAEFVAEYEALQGVTQYLCWVVAEPSQTVNLEVTYTMADAPEITIGTAPATAGRHGLGSPQALRRWWQAHWHAFAVWRTRVYAAIGMGPLNYELHTPVHDHAGSYYFLLRSPEGCRISFLDWGLDNSIENRSGELDCAHSSVHIHNGSTREQGQAASAPRSSIAGSTINVFLRADLRDHGPLLVTAALTVLLAFLAERGQFVGGGGVSSVLLIAPSAVLAYVAQRQPHHFTAATRWLGPLLGAYLLANIVFVVSVKYDVLGGDTFLGRPNVLDDLISAGIGLASLVLIVWFLALRARDGFLQRAFGGKRLAEDSVEHYSRLGLRYADRTVLAIALVLIAILAAAAASDGFGWGSGRARAVAAAASARRLSTEAAESQAAQTPPTQIGSLRPHGQAVPARGHASNRAN